MRPVNLDHAAASPLLPEALEAMMPFFTEHFGNPQSIHSLGHKPQEAIESARGQVASLINASPAEIIFTASASESNNLALKGLTGAAQGTRPKTGSPKGHIIVSAIEHPSVQKPVQTLASSGFEVTELKVDKHGLVEPEDLDKAIRPDTVLVSVMHANNEVGTIEPLAELARVCRRHNVLFHSDGTAAVGRIPVDVHKLGLDSYSFSAQSFYGPKGAAALFVKAGHRLHPLIEGGVQEQARRAGTENVPAIVGMGRAAEIARQNMAHWAATMKTLSVRLVAMLSEKLDHIIFTGHAEQRLPGHVSFCVEFVEGEAMLLLLDDAGIVAASGSACTAKTLKASHVLLAMGLPHAIAQSSLVLTMGKDTTMEDVNYFLETFPPIVKRLRAMSPLYAKLLKGEDPYRTEKEFGHGGH